LISSPNSFNLLDRLFFSGVLGRLIFLVSFRPAWLSVVPCFQFLSCNTKINLRSNNRSLPSSYF
jgi:hypothetical protein